MDWSAIERCRCDYEIGCLHLEAGDILRQFGEFNPSRQDERQNKIERFVRRSFPVLFGDCSEQTRSTLYAPTLPHSNARFRLGFDVAASDLGDLAVMYMDEAKSVTI